VRAHLMVAAAMEDRASSERYRVLKIALAARSRSLPDPAFFDRLAKSLAAQCGLPLALRCGPQRTPIRLSQPLPQFQNRFTDPPKTWQSSNNDVSDLGAGG
jgi:hypothetical protein